MKYHGGHIVLSLEWGHKGWWKPSAYLIRNQYMPSGRPYGGFVGIFGLGLFFILYRKLEPLNEIQRT